MRGGGGAGGGGGGGNYLILWSVQNIYVGKFRLLFYVTNCFSNTLYNHFKLISLCFHSNIVAIS